MGSADVDDGGTRWRAEDAFVISYPAWLTGLQQGEDATSVVVGDDDGQVRPRLIRADDHPVVVMQERQVAHQRVRRSPGLCECDTDGRRDTTIDASQPAAGNNGERRASGRR